ncbi:hypothetical protein RHS01_08317 [Rhizoctonia solani]|uniref:Uncharacterized protein n=1 Tax=Rhizoctonia solani TaxID=456999 RepID=A0A8H7M249_9AGAM|nr:hypothetical protein RHS01_08317 [Rhizoctonia solani]
MAPSHPYNRVDLFIVPSQARNGTERIPTSVYNCRPSVPSLPSPISHLHPPALITHTLDPSTKTKFILDTQHGRSYPYRKQQQTLGWEYHLLFTRFCELASAPSHPAFAHIPPPTSFPQTQWLLRSNSSRSTNVLGLLLSDLFVDFYPWLENLAVHQTSCSTLLRFERHMFNQAQLRHTWQWWRHNRQTTPGACFRPSVTGKREGGDAAAPGQLEDRSDIYVEGILGRGVEEGVQRGGGG